MHNPRPIYEFLAATLQSGQRGVLVTVLAVTGASSRNPGSHLAVAEDGRFVGSLSGGCIEAAVVAEALNVLATGCPREVRFGAGSPYIDIRLPCGGSVDLLFNPVDDDAWLAAVIAAIAGRRTIGVRLPRGSGRPTVIRAGADWAIDVSAASVDLNYIPPLRVAILGHGAAVGALESAAHAYGAEVSVFTPDADRVDEARRRGSEAMALDFPSQAVDLRMDRWTAAVFLFHDHDWEPSLLQVVLAAEPFFVGAMGSLITHQHRLDRLRDLGVKSEDRDRIVAPIGLIPSSRDPETLAISILAQVVALYHQRFAAELAE